jgi:5-methyltetrahydropteroyltriglutamate--homocysteine methyltransferase
MVYFKHELNSCINEKQSFDSFNVGSQNRVIKITSGAQHMARTHLLGFPRIGAQRELKSAQESFWQNQCNELHLQGVASELRQRHWATQHSAGLSWVCAGDFSFYDHMLSMSVLLGALPERFGFDASTLDLAQYFQLARGNTAQPALEMTKWFDTNYHYLVPELAATTSFEGSSSTFLKEIDQALALGLEVKPVLVGPITFLWLSKTHATGFEKRSLLPKAIASYRKILQALHARGVQWVQVDEPALCLDLPAA